MAARGLDETAPLLNPPSEADISLRGGVAHAGTEPMPALRKTAPTVSFYDTSPGNLRGGSRVTTRTATLPNRARWVWGRGLDRFFHAPLQRHVERGT
jgi:hypothetical protein